MEAIATRVEAIASRLEAIAMFETQKKTKRKKGLIVRLAEFDRRWGRRDVMIKDTCCGGRRSFSPRANSLSISSELESPLHWAL